MAWWDNYADAGAPPTDSKYSVTPVTYADGSRHTLSDVQGASERLASESSDQWWNKYPDAAAPASDLETQAKMIEGMGQADLAMKMATLPMNLPPPEVDTRSPMKAFLQGLPGDLAQNADALNEHVKDLGNYTGVTPLLGHAGFTSDQSLIPREALPLQSDSAFDTFIRNAAPPIVKGVGESLRENVSSLATPANVGIILGTLALPEGAIAGRLISMGFGAQAAYGAAQAAKAAYGESDPQQRAKLVTDALFQGAIATGATAHGVRGKAAPAEPVKSAFENRFENPLPTEAPTSAATQYGRETSVHDAFKGIEPAPRDTITSNDNPELGTLSDALRAKYERNQTLQAERDRMNAQLEATSPRAVVKRKVIQDRIDAINREMASPVEQGAPTVATAPTRATIASVPERETISTQSATESPKAPLSDTVAIPSVEPEAETPPLQVSPDSPEVLSRIANRFTQERMDSGELGEVTPNEGRSTKEMIESGLAMKPEEVNQHVSDIMHGKGGDEIKQAQAIRAEEARLSVRSSQASEAFERSPNDPALKQAADDAFKDLTDFHNGPIKKLKERFHATGMGLQGEIPADLTTFNGLREKWLRESGEAPSAKDEPGLRKIAERAREAQRIIDEETVGRESINPADVGAKERVATAEAAEKAAETRMRLNKNRAQGGFVSPDMLRDAAVIGAGHIRRGLTNFRDWSSKMVRHLGEWIRPHLADLFGRAKKLMSAGFQAAQRLDESLSGRGFRISRPEGGSMGSAGGKFKRVKPLSEMTREEADAAFRKGDHYFNSLYRWGEPQTEHPFYAQDLMSSDMFGSQGEQKGVHGVTFDNPLKAESRYDASIKLLGKNIYEGIGKVTTGERSPGARAILDADNVLGRAAAAKGYDAIVTPREIQVIDKSKLPPSERVRFDEENGYYTNEEGEPLVEGMGYDRAVERANKLGRFSKPEGGAIGSAGGKRRTSEQRVAAAIKRTEATTKKINEKIETGDITRDKRPEPIVPNKRLTEARGELQRARDQFDALYAQAQRRALPAWQRGLDNAVKGSRFLKLAGIKIFGKLGGAAITRMGLTPVEHAVGKIIGEIIPGDSPEWGGSFIPGEVAAIKGFVKGVKDIPTILKGERSNAEAEFGKKDYPGAVGKLATTLDLPGRAHAAEKQPVKEAERARATANQESFERRQGNDPLSEDVRQQIGKQAQESALRAVFMNDNVLSTMWRSAIGGLEKSKKFPTQGYVLAKGMQWAIPIVRVPTNIAIEAGVHTVGTLSGSAKLLQVMHRGFETIQPAERDFIIRHMTKGLVGGGLFFLGYANPNMFGGFYQPGEKRKANDVKWGSARVNGVNIPAWLLHAPAFIVLNAGATFRRLRDAKDKRGGTGNAILGTLHGLEEEIPFAEGMQNIDNLLSSGYQGTKARGMTLSGTVLPQASRDIAKWLDDKERKPKTELDYLKMGIPGLRETLKAK